MIFGFQKRRPRPRSRNVLAALHLPPCSMRSMLNTPHDLALGTQEILAFLSVLWYFV